MKKQRALTTIAKIPEIHHAEEKLWAECKRKMTAVS